MLCARWQPLTRCWCRQHEAGNASLQGIQEGLKSREAVLLGAVVLLTGLLLGQSGEQSASLRQTGLWSVLQRAALGLAVANGAAALILQGCRLWQDVRLYPLLF